MRLRSRLAWVAVVVIIVLLAWTVAARADKLELKDGRVFDGIIVKVEKGQVTMTVAGAQQQFDVLDVVSMNFDTPHVGEVEHPLHFARTTEAQDVARHIAEADQAALNLRMTLDQIKKQWDSGKTIGANETAAWEDTKDQFARALSRYQEVLGDFYAHVVTRLDAYDRLTADAAKVHVGVKGAFNMGSPLISKEAQQSPLKKFVPGPWYDTIFYRGYSQGYTDGFHARPREFVAP